MQPRQRKTKPNLSQPLNDGCDQQRLRSATVRIDRNLDRFPLWVPSHRKPRALEARTITRELASKTQMVVINPTAKYGDLTTDDYITFLGLLRCWCEKGQPVGNVSFSVSQLAKILKKQWGGHTYKGLTNSLMRLRSTAIEWHESFFDAESKTFYRTLHPFNLLEDLKLARRTKDGSVIGEQGTFRFNANLYRNLINDYTKPVLLDKLLTFRSELAQILYIHLDLMLYGKSRYERCTAGLFSDIGFSAKRYAHRAKRRDKLLEVIAELNGAELPTGYIQTIRLEPTVDGKDDKIVVIKKLKGRKALSPVDLVEDTTEQTFEHDTGDASCKLQAEELVRLFYQVFHEVEVTAPASRKERQQAQTLIDEVGYDLAQYLVKRSQEFSQSSKFKVQVFGGILQFKVRAIAEYNKAQQQKRKLQRVASRAEPEESTLSHDEQVKRNRALIEQRFGQRSTKQA